MPALTCAHEAIFSRFNTSDFYSQIPKSPYFKAFLRSHFSALDINTTVSTWLEMIASTSLSHYARLSFVGTYPLPFRVSVETYPLNNYHHNNNILGSKFTVVSLTYTSIFSPLCDSIVSNI